MKYLVWIVSALLAGAFLFIGGMKVMAPADVLAAASDGVPVVLLKVAGTAEVLGALGLILPAATRIAPALTPIAAAGLVVVMLGATIINIVLGFYPVAAETVVLALLAGFVAWARATKVQVPARTATRTAQLDPVS